MYPRHSGAYLNNTPARYIVNGPHELLRRMNHHPSNEELRKFEKAPELVARKPINLSIL